MNMEKILFLCDAAGDLTPEDIAGRPIRIIPATLRFGGRECREFFDITPEDFCRELMELDEIPLTQHATPIHFLEAYRAAIREGYTHVIVVTISSTASGVIGSASVARDMLLDEREDAPDIHLVDSRGYSMMFGHLLLEGVRQAEAGVSCEEIAADLRDRASRCEALFMVYSLKHIRKSGRIGGMSAFFGEAMSIRPILRCLDGTILPIEKVRGEKNLIPRMIELVTQYADDPSSQTLYLVSNVLPPEEVNMAEEKLRAAFAPQGIVRHYIGPSVSANTGPHCMGIIYYGVKRV